MKQTTIARSITEAQYMSLANRIAEVLWIQSLLHELCVSSPHKPAIYCDNLSIVHMTANPILHARTKHLELDLFFVREKVQ